jgi:predicted Fe-S protein YdhL (DUF1289 family)
VHREFQNDSKMVAGYAYSTRAERHLVPSPCISVCVVSPVSRLCEGCHRTLDEIAAWPEMTSVQKRMVWHRIQQRTLAQDEVQNSVVIPAGNT